MKQCSKCKRAKSVSDFYKNKQTKDGLRSDCKRCCKSLYEKYYQTHKSINAKQRKEYQRIHMVKLVDYDRKYRKTLIGYLRKLFVLIKQRCNNPKTSNYKYYGGRGIKCLFKSVDDFVDYVVNALQVDPRGLQIDRIDNDRHYERGNIRFVTPKENSNNRRKCIY